MKKIPRLQWWTATVALAYLMAFTVDVEDAGGAHAFLDRCFENRQAPRWNAPVPERIRSVPFLKEDSFWRESNGLSSLRLTSEDSAADEGKSSPSSASAVGPKAAGRRRGERSSSSTRRRSPERRPQTGRRAATLSPSPEPPENLPTADGRDNARESGATASVGPKAESRRRSSTRERRSPGSERRSGPKQRRQGSTSGPKAAARRSSRAPPGVVVASSPPPPGVVASPPPAAASRQATRSSSQEPFDGKAFTARQTSNPDAPRLDLRAVLSSSDSGFRCVTPGVRCLEPSEENRDLKVPEEHSPFEYRSLDDLLSVALAKQGIHVPPPEGLFSLSNKFNSDASFRRDLRSAIRLDVFETTPFYAKLPEKAKSVLLLPDSSLEGSWRIPDTTANEAAASIATTESGDKNNDDETEETPVRRMKHTTRVLNRALSEHRADSAANHGVSGQSTSFSFTGDDLFEALGAICGQGASTHWIDIYGVQDRTINHSWHLDAGRSPQNCKTVLWGFPPEDHYSGTGVFSHIVSLEDPFGCTLDICETDTNQAVSDRPRMEPILFEGTPGEDVVFRPLYEAGKELLIYRDVDVLHSAPDVAYRASVMRFM